MGKLPGNLDEYEIEVSKQKKRVFARDYYDAAKKGGIKVTRKRGNPGRPRKS